MKMSSKRPPLPDRKDKRQNENGDEDADDVDVDSLASTVASDEEEEYVVEAVLAEKMDPRDGSMRYLVKWEGYAITKCTWEPEDHFQDPATLGTWRAKKATTPKEDMFDWRAWDAEREREADLTKRRREEREKLRRERAQKLGGRRASGLRNTEIDSPDIGNQPPNSNARLKPEPAQKPKASGTDKAPRTTSKDIAEAANRKRPRSDSSDTPDARKVPPANKKPPKRKSTAPKQHGSSAGETGLSAKEQQPKNHPSKPLASRQTIEETSLKAKIPKKPAQVEARRVKGVNEPRKVTEDPQGDRTVGHRISSKGEAAAQVSTDPSGNKRTTANAPLKEATSWFSALNQEGLAAKENTENRAKTRLHTDIIQRVSVIGSGSTTDPQAIGASTENKSSTPSHLLENAKDIYLKGQDTDADGTFSGLKQTGKSKSMGSMEIETHKDTDFTFSVLWERPDLMDRPVELSTTFTPTIGLRKHLLSNDTGSGLSITRYLSTTYIEKYLVPHLGLPLENSRVYVDGNGLSALLDTLRILQAAAVVLTDHLSILFVPTCFGRNLTDIFGPTTTEDPSANFCACFYQPFEDSPPSTTVNGNLPHIGLSKRFQKLNILEGTRLRPDIKATSFVFIHPPGALTETLELKSLAYYQYRTANVEEKSLVRFWSYDELLEHIEEFKAHDASKKILIHVSLRSTLHLLPGVTELKSDCPDTMFYMYGTQLNHITKQITWEPSDIYVLGGVVFLPFEVVREDAAELSRALEIIENSAVWQLALPSNMPEMLERAHEADVAIEKYSAQIEVIDKLRTAWGREGGVKVDIPPVSSESLELYCDIFAHFQSERCRDFRSFVLLCPARMSESATKVVYSNIELMSVKEFLRIPQKDVTKTQIGRASGTNHSRSVSLATCRLTESSIL